MASGSHENNFWDLTYFVEVAAMNNSRHENGSWRLTLTKMLFPWSPIHEGTFVRVGRHGLFCVSFGYFRDCFRLPQNLHFLVVWSIYFLVQSIKWYIFHKKLNLLYEIKPWWCWRKKALMFFVKKYIHIEIKPWYLIKKYKAKSNSPKLLWKALIRWKLTHFFFSLFSKHCTDAYAHKRTHTHPYEYTTQPYPYKHLRETEPANPQDWRSHHWHLATVTFSTTTELH